MEPPPPQEGSLRKRSTGRATSAFLHRPRSSINSQVFSSPKSTGVSFIMDELKKRDEEIA